MAKKNKGPKLKYDSRGGVMVVSRAMRESSAYESMPPTAKVLMDLLQMQWRNDRPVAYGVREAGQKIGCKPETAGKAFKVLQERGFIVCETESLFNSRTGGKARECRLISEIQPTIGRNGSRNIKATVPKRGTQNHFVCSLSVHKFI